MSFEMILALGLAFVVLAVVLLKQRSRVSRASAPGNAPLDPAEVERYVRENITRIGRTAFPDNPDVEWILHGFSHGPDLILAEVEPRPDDVGYSRFKLGFVATGSGAPAHVATYSLEEGVYVLLATGAGAPRGLPRRLE